MIKEYFKKRQYLYVRIIKSIVVFDKKKNEITKINDNLTYREILNLTHQTKCKILELSYYTYKYTNLILKIFYDELDDFKTASTGLVNPFNNGFGGKTIHNKINSLKQKKRKTAIRIRNTRKKRAMYKKILTRRK